jgi:HPt (histidine-containing phosphotransfer) domain-containing protein
VSRAKTNNNNFVRVYTLIDFRAYFPASLAKNTPLSHNILPVLFLFTGERGNMAIGIPEIDEGNFNDLMDGDEGLYASVLSSFIDKTPAVLSKLAAVSKETLPDYATTVHGLKGACANICAEQARKMAFSLEQKSRAGDWAGVQAENGPFIKYVEDLMVKLKDWYKNHK